MKICSKVTAVLLALLAGTSSAFACTAQDKITLAKQGYAKPEIEGMCGPSSGTSTKKDVAKNRGVSRQGLYLRLAKALSNDFEVLEPDPPITQRNQYSVAYVDNRFKVTHRFQRIKYGSTISSGEEIYSFDPKEINFQLAKSSSSAGSMLLSLNCSNDKRCVTLKSSTSYDGFREYNSEGTGFFYPLSADEDIRQIVDALR